MTRNDELISRIRGGEKELENTLISENMGLVRSVALRLAFSAERKNELEDLCQIGAVGLLKASRNFDLGRGLMFSTYAVPVIAGEIRRFLRDDGQLRVSRTLKERAVLLRREEIRLRRELGREATLSEVAEAAGLGIEEATEALEAAVPVKSIDEPTADGDFTLEDTLSSPDPVSDIDSIAIREAVKNLVGDDRRLIILRYFSGKTQQQTAEIMNMTQVQVSRREKKILQSLLAELT